MLTFLTGCSYTHQLERVSKMNNPKEIFKVIQILTLRTWPRLDYLSRGDLRLTNVREGGIQAGRLITADMRYPHPAVLPQVDTLLMSYWRSFDDLEHFSRDRNEAHYLAWIRFYKAVGLIMSVICLSPTWDAGRGAWGVGGMVGFLPFSVISADVYVFLHIPLYAD